MRRVEDWRYEKMRLIKDVLVHKPILPIHVQNKLMKEIDFQIKTLGNKGSLSPVKKQCRRLKTVEQSPVKLKMQKSGSYSQNRSLECMLCRKYNFLNEVTIDCNTDTHVFHEKCILDHFKEQCNENYRHFICPCGMKLCAEKVKHLKIRGIREIVEFFLNQQLQIISMMLQTQKCRNQQCNFFWIVNQKNGNQKKSKIIGRKLKPISKDYCPNC